MTKVFLICLALIGLAVPVSAQDYPDGTARVLELAQKQPQYMDAIQLNPKVVPTSDGRSFYLIWKREGENPTNWIVSLHGHDSFATDDLVAWSRHLAGKNIGLISLQWWLGGSEANYLAPNEIYREIDIAIRNLEVKPKRIMLEGFSRGSANIYAVKALDVHSGNNYFNLTVANAGGAMTDYPPNKAISAGRFGARPFDGTIWVTVCGMKDENPEQDGCPAMRRAAEWVTGLGGVITDRIEDQNLGHGALHMSPQNVNHLLDIFQNPNP